jgi:hypothetical protein
MTHECGPEAERPQGVRRTTWRANPPTAFALNLTTLSFRYSISNIQFVIYSVPRSYFVVRST